MEKKSIETLYLIGGCGQDSMIVRSFDRSMQITERETIRMKERSYFAAVFFENSLYVMGGWQNKNSVQRFDIQTKQ